MLVKHGHISYHTGMHLREDCTKSAQKSNKMGSVADYMICLMLCLIQQDQPIHIFILSGTSWLADSKQ